MKTACPILIITVLIISCREEINYQFTNRTFDPAFNLRLDELKQLGFRHIPEDVPLIGKKFGDTLIYFQFEEVEDDSSPTGFYTEFNSNKSVDDLIQIWGQNDIVITQNLQIDSGYYQLKLKNVKNGLLFNCSVEPTTIFEKIVNINFQYPDN